MTQGEAFAAQDRFPNNKVICAWPEDAFKEIQLDERTAVVTLTHEPNLDDIALKNSLKSKCFYIGALGSKKTHKKRIDRFMQDGFNSDLLKRINGPIGLPYKCSNTSRNSNFNYGRNYFFT